MKPDGLRAHPDRANRRQSISRNTVHHRDSRGAMATTLSTHRIWNVQVAQRIVASTGLAPPALVVEVGAGEGILTAELATRGLRVLAVERERESFCSLRERFASNPCVTPVLRDFLDYPLPRTTRYVVFGNPPFSITSTILRHALAATNPPDAIFLVMQREAAFRWGGLDRESLLSLTTRLRYDIDIRLALRRRDFDPAPAADCVLLAMVRRPRPLLTGAERTTFLALVTAAMRGRSRTTSAALSGPVARQPLARAARLAAFDLTRRPSEPRFEEWVLLAKALSRPPRCPRCIAPPDDSSRADSKDGGNIAPLYWRAGKNSSPGVAVPDKA